jgi:hypothetical protein
MSYVFGDYATGADTTSSAGLDIGYYPAQDVSVDDVYFGSENETNGWSSAVNKIGNVFGNVMDTGGGIFNSYVDKLLDREVYGSSWYGENAADTVRPINTVDPSAQPRGGIDTKTLIIGGVVLAAFALIALKK